MQRSAKIVWPLIAYLASVGASGWLATVLRTAASSVGSDRQQRATENAAIAPVPGMSRAFETDEQMLTAIMSAVVQDEPLLRSHQLHDTLGRLNSAELSALFNKAVQVEDTDRRDPLLNALLARWLRVDPEAARAAVRPYQARFRTTTRFDWQSSDWAVSQAWAAAVPEETLAEAIANQDARWARTLAGIALMSLSGGDPARELERLIRLPEGPLRAELCVPTIRALADKDYAAAEAYLNLVPDPRLRAKVQAEILGRFAARDPAAGLARLAALAPSLPAGVDGIRLVTEVLGEASKKDPEASLAAVDGLPENLRMQALGAVLVGWADEHPVDALTWSAAHGVDLNEPKGSLSIGDKGMSWRPLLSVAFGRDKEKTLEWVRTLPASPERDSMLTPGLWGGTMEQKSRVYAELTPAGQVSAAGEMVRMSLRYGGVGLDQIEPWVKAQPPGAARTAAIRELADYQAGNTPERLDELAKSWEPGPDRDAAMRGIASLLASANNPLRALEFARQVNDQATRESAFEKIAQDWLNRDKSAARAWIASAPELSAEQKRVVLRMAEEQ
jgi:hypothetical protein